MYQPTNRAVCFCGTFGRVAPPGCYPAPCSVELGLSSDSFPCYDEATLWEKAARDRLACLGTNLTIAHTGLIVKRAFDKMLSLDYHLDKRTEKDYD